MPPPLVRPTTNTIRSVTGTRRSKRCEIRASPPAHSRQSCTWGLLGALTAPRGSLGGADQLDFVLSRPDPMGGVRVEGGLRAAWRSPGAHLAGSRARIPVPRLSRGHP